MFLIKPVLQSLSLTERAEDEEKRRSIGEKARELYEREFSPTTFEKDLRHVVDAALTS